MESLCRRLAPSLIAWSGASVADADGLGADKELDDPASAGRLDGAGIDAASGISASLPTRSAANRTLFNARTVGASPAQVAAACKRPSLPPFS